ncbi:hypothetical protein PoB_006608800 [Plakobranchus ocellatus]|uniref:Uncharacterized protein n=1 Tax=Plakobranchus ocellatus TaxID=259542 RepID=A0AAV4D5V8_9GAST|nr:hypothetical protein PoB_006608800 [Plakobranchus ocellatus]
MLVPAGGVHIHVGSVSADAGIVHQTQCISERVNLVVWSQPARASQPNTSTRFKDGLNPRDHRGRQTIIHKQSITETSSSTEGL